MRKSLIVQLLLCILIVLSSCRRNNSFTSINTDIPNECKIDLLRIPQNDDYSCATTSLDMIISYYAKTAKPIDKDYIWGLSQTNKDQVRKYGNDITGLDRIADHYKYKHIFRQGMSFDELRYYISINTPVIVFIHFDKEHTHATLINGYDVQKRIFYVLDPSVEETIMPESFLEEHWSALLSNPKTESYRAGYILFNNR